MKANKILTLLVTLCMMCTMLPVINVSADGEDVTSSALFDENAPVGETIHYNSGGFEKEGMKAGGNAKKNKFEIAAEKKSGNRYLLCETLDGSTDYHWDLSIAAPTRYMVFQFDVTHNGEFPAGNMQYKDGLGNTAGIFLSWSETGLTFIGDTSKNIRKGKWANVAIVVDFLKNTATSYFDGKVVSKNASIGSAPSISMIRFYFNASNAVGTSMMIDNFKIYEGTEPREVPDVEMLNEISKVDTTSTKAITMLGKSVALSVGGTGIFYGREKHPLDAPAYIKSGRTLIPVRAVSEAFGLDVSWDENTRTVTIDGKSKIKIDSTEMILPDGSTYTLDVPAEISNSRTFLPLRALCEQILGKKVTWNDKGIIVIDDTEMTIAESDENTINNYLLYDRPTKAQITELFNSANKNTHPRVMIDKEIYDRIVYNYNHDELVKKWGDGIIAESDDLLKKYLPRYDIPDGYRLLTTCRDVYERSKRLALSYILTKDAKYAEGLYDVYEAVAAFPDWNPQHFLDIAEMTAAVAIGYDWCYDYWSDEQKAMMEKVIYEYGLTPANDAYYGNLGTYGWWTPGNETNWNVVCNGGTLMGAVAVFDKHPEFCSNLIEIQCRDVEAMLNSFYPDGAWFEGIVYWEYTMAYTVNMLSTLEACFKTDFNLSKAPGLSNSIYYNIAGEGGTGLNNFHDASVVHETTDTYFWLSNKYNLPGVTNLRLNKFDNGKFTPTPLDILWYDTSIKGTDFYLPKDSYLRGVEFVSMRNSWVDDSGAWLSYHGGAAEANHSHLDTGTFVFDLAGVRWAQDLGGDNYNLPGYFSKDKYNFYRLRPEGHNVYVIDPDNTPGQTLDHFAQVETLVSKDRGAYSVLDLTSAYKTWVTKARRGYKLDDDRRSAVIRDEIDFIKSGREFIWFMNTPTNAEIEIVDKNTAYITSKGLTLKFMIDSDIENYEFGIMDAVPMEKSPVVAGQNANVGIKKLYLKGKSGKSNYVECKMILSTDPNAEAPLSNVKIDDWSIPDGTMREIPALDSLTVNGQKVEGFSPTKTIYTRTVRYDETAAANVEAKAADNVMVEITPAVKVSDDVKIKVYYKDDPSMYRIYKYSTEVLPKLEDLDGYTRIQVAGHRASAEPEEAHTAEKVSDNDTDAESRWAASDAAWIILDLGREESFDSVGIAAWKGGERTYNFKIEVSNDGQNWAEVIAERGTDTSNGDNIGIYPFGKEVTARYVRYSGLGNSVNEWNSLTEIAVLKKK